MTDRRPIEQGQAMKNGRPGGTTDWKGSITERGTSMDSYYGRPIVKEPVWNPEIPVYFFTGGVAGASAVLHGVAKLTGNERLAQSSLYIGAAMDAVSPVLLIKDLGRPERFLHMLRVFKPTSPLSVGSYILSPFSAAAGATAAVELLGWFPRLKRFGGVVSALFGGPMSTYTAVLLANTSVPSWHEPHLELPFVFAGSAMAAGGGLTMMFTPVEEAGPSRKMGVTGAAIELGAMHRVETAHGIVSEPFHEGLAGKLLKVAKACTGSGAALTVVAGRRRWGQVASGTLLAAGSLLTRFGVFEAGMASAKDPKYTVIPQKARKAAREAGQAAGAAPSVTR